MRVKTVYASEVAHLDSNVHTGGGTDDTLALQAVLDQATEDVAIRLVMDGAALVRGLRVHSNTTIECLSKECGFFQMANQPCAIITCGLLEKPEFQVHDVKLLGGTYNQDCLRQGFFYEDHIIYQPGDFPYECMNHCSHGPYALEFCGVQFVHIDGIVIRNFRTYALTMDHFENVTIENTWLDLPDHVDSWNQDGFHFWGPGRFLTIRNVGGRVGDDFMNLGPDERDRKSSITDVLIDGVYLDRADQAIRLLARYEGSLERITIRNVSGSYKSFGFYMCPWYMDHHSGRIADVLIENINLVALENNYDYREPMLFCVAGIVENMTIQNVRHKPLYDGRTLMEIGLPYYTLAEYHQYEQLANRQRIKGLVLRDVTILEDETAPVDTDYIVVYTKVDSMILKDIVILKDQKEANGNLIAFKEKGGIDTLVTQQIFAKGLKTLIDDPAKVGRHLSDLVVSE